VGRRESPIDKVSMDLGGGEVWIVHYGRLVGSSVVLEMIGYCPLHSSDVKSSVDRGDASYQVDPSIHTCR
jgi:hypothetical protein